MLEAEAREMYEFITGQTVVQVGFCLSNGCGASPDGLVGDNGILEIKCPLIYTHVSYLLENKVPTDYFQQVQGQLAVTGRQWCDFMSYYPGLKPLIIRATRDEAFISALNRELSAFNDDLQAVINYIKQ